jgi:ABC-2 type transport system ATP-binding protein
VADEVLVTLDRMTKAFDKAADAALRELSAEMLGGRVTGMVGPDGAGKTTLMRLMASLLLPTRGMITVCGHDTASAPGPIHEDVAYMPQRFGLYEDLTVLQNLNLYADLRNVTGDERNDAFERLLRFTGLARFTDRLAGKLSGGMKQKLGLACSLVRAPRLLLLDEPSVGVDPVSRRELWRMVYDLVDQGIGVVWSTAYLDEAERCADVLLLDKGRLLYHGKPSELTKRARGRTFAVRNITSDRRAVLASALRRDEVIDGVIQGENVRLVLKEGATPPTPAELGAPGEAQVSPVPPRFEDAFVSLLGGIPKSQVEAATTPADPVPSPLYSGEKRADSAAAREGVRVRGRLRDHDGEPTRVASAKPLTPTLSPEYRGEGVSTSFQSNVAPVVEAKGLTKRFGDFTAADHVSFAIRAGEVFGLLGPNGAGKSTVFKMMCGLLKPTEGAARVAGVDLVKAPADARARLGYMAQKFSLYGDLSVRQNLRFFSGVYGLCGRRQDDAIKRMVDSFGLSRLVNANAGSLPLGFKQRLALACAIMHRPAVLFLDEPTSGVDPITRREFWARINAMVGRGVTVMVTTHFLDEAEYCDRIGLVYQGQMIATGTPGELKAKVRTAEQPDPTLEDAFIGLVEEHDRKPHASEGGGQP